MITKGRVVFDRGELRKAEITPQGFLRAPALATRVGVFTYRLGDGSVRRELRHPEDVFAPESLATLKGVPVTNDHPNIKNPEVLLVTPENVREYMVGYTGEDVQPSDRFVEAYLTVTDAEAIAAVEAGKTEVSCGYTRELEEVAGEYEGVPYDVRQRNIIYNHLAIVDRGRAGPEVRIRLDAADAVQVDETNIGAKRMEKVTINGVEFECSPELKAAIESALNAKKDGDNATEVKSGEGDPAPKTDDGDKKTEELEAKLDAANAEIAKLKGARTDAADPVKVRELVKARKRLEKIAERVLPAAEHAAIDSLDDRALKVAVIKAEQKGANLDGKSDVYVDARFDAVADALEAGDGKGKEMGKDLADGRETAADAEDKVEAARKRQSERAANAWKAKK